MTDLNIRKAKFYDDRVVQPAPSYAIQESNLSVTSTRFNAVSQTSSTLNFNVNAPSLSVFIDRKLPLTSDVVVKYNFENSADVTVPANSSVMCQSIGRSVSLSPYPLHQLFNSIQVSINDTIVSSQVGDYLNEMMRLTDFRDNRLQSLTPTLQDTYAKFNDAVQASNNPLGGFFDSDLDKEVARGSYSMLSFCSQTGGLGAQTLVTNVVAGVNLVIDNFGNLVYQNTTGAGVDVPANTVQTAYLRFTATEYLQCSPFIWNMAQAKDDVGLFGVQNMQILINIASASKCLSLVSGVVGETFTPDLTTVAFAQTAFYDAHLDVTFITPPLSLALPEKSVVPYHEYNVFKTTSSAVIQPQSSASPVYTNIGTIQSNSIVLSQVPDYLMVYVKPSSINGNESLSQYAPITKVNILFDNYSGLLNTMPQFSLYNFSYDNGIKMGYDQFRGLAKVHTAGPNDPTQVQLTASPLVLQFSKDIPTTSGIAPGVLGQFNFSIEVQYANTDMTTAKTFELGVIPINSGFMISSLGQSLLLKSILSESDVVNAPVSRVMGRAGINRYVGSGLLDMLSSGIGKAMKLWDDLPSGVKDAAKEVAKYGMKKMTGNAMPTGGKRNKKVNLNDLM